MGVAVVAALIAAAFFAAASALQHRGATTTPTFGGFGPTSVGRFVWQTLRHPAWLAGTLADVVGLGFHGLALHLGPLTLIQPVMVIGLVFALPLRQWLDRRRPDRQEMLSATALTGGLIVFLVAATPASGPSAADRLPTLTATILISIAVVACAGAGRILRGTPAAVVLGAGAGVAFAGTAAALKATTDLFARGPVAVVTSWQLYALLVAGAGGLLLSQLAFQAGPLRASLPAMNTVDPVISLVVGVVVYDERLRGGGLALSAAALGAVIVVVAAIILSSAESTDPSESRATPPLPP